MPTTTIRVDSDLLQRVESIKPKYISTTGFFQLLAEQALDTSFTLAEPRGPQRGTDSQGWSPSKSSSLNKRDKDVDVSLRAEEAHVSAAAIHSPPRRTNEIPGNLFAHEELIRNYWKVKPKSKSPQAWTLMTNQLTKLQDLYGDSVVRDQLIQAEANRWQNITVLKYEKFGLPRSNTATQASSLDYAAMDAVVTPW